MNKTSRQFNESADECKQVFINKMQDYGTAWRVLRPSSITDQIYIKAQRIRSIEEKGTQKINEGIKPEFIGIVNYSVMALVQLELGSSGENSSLNEAEVIQFYDKYIAEAHKLMDDKNHDYGEAWRNMRVSSLDDIILMKLLRIKQIEDNMGITKVSEGLDANYYDIINYAIFALIKINEEQ
ncbi:MAG: DUF1599 domain-containing protein [Bacteroidota bacterium]